MLQALSHLHSNTPTSVSYWRAQHWTQHSRCVSPGLSRGKGLPSSTRRQCFSEYSPSGWRKGLLLAHVQLGVHQDHQVLFCRAAFQMLPAYTDAWGYSSPGAELGTSICWASWGSCWPISPACWGSSGQQHNYLVWQQLLPVLHHLHICWGCSLLCANPGA